MMYAHSVPSLELRNSLTDLFHNAGCIRSQYNRVLDRDSAIIANFPVHRVQSCGLDFDEKLSRARYWCWDILNDVRPPWFEEYESFMSGHRGYGNEKQEG